MAKKRLFLPLFVIFAALATPVTTLGFEEAYRRYCMNGVLATSLSVTERQMERSKVVGLGIDLNFLGKSNTGESIRNISAAKPGVLIILLIILTILMLLSFLAFLGFCCCCDRTKTPSDNCAKWLIGIGAIFLVGFIGLFITAIVFIGLMEANVTDAACSIARIPFELVYGAALKSDARFIGMVPIQQVFTNFTTSVKSMSDASPNYVNMFNKDLSSATGMAIQSLRDLVSTYNGSKTADGNATSVPPITIKTLTPLVNPMIDAEFTLFDKTASRLTKACDNAIKLIAMRNSEILWPPLSGAINDAIEQIKSMTMFVSNDISPMLVSASQVAATTRAGYWICFSFGIAIVFLAILMPWCVWRMTVTKSDEKRTMAKFALVLMAIFGFIVGLAAIYLLLTSIAITTGCTNMPTVLNSNKTQIMTIPAKWGVTVTDNVRKVLETCVATDASGNFAEFFPYINTYGPALVLDYIDGMLSFKNIIKFVSETDRSSPAINATVEIWSKYRDSYWADQPTAVQILSQLNTLVACGKMGYAFNARNCTYTNCFGIFQNASPNAPICASANAPYLFGNLKQFVVQEYDLLSGMITALSGPSSMTPNTLQSNYRNLFYQTIPDFQNADAIAGSFMKSLPPMTGGFIDNANCTIMRTHFLHTEEKVCFSYNNYLYYFTCMIVFCVLFTLFFAWCYCCSLFNVGERVESLVGTLPMNIKSEIRLNDKEAIEIDSNPLH